MTAETPFEYAGSELDLFADAVNWRAYWASLVRPYLGRRVLEVGAGIGTVTAELMGDRMDWTAVEPDPVLADRIRERVVDPDRHLRVVTGGLDAVPTGEGFDTVLYIDVLEHIEDDRAEAAKAFTRVAPGGCIVILAPAHQWLFTPFDVAIGHYRRYSRSTLARIRPVQAREIRSDYLDSAGVLASLGNRVLLRSASPTRSQIRMWDQRLVPMSRHFDRATGHQLGKSILAVWERPRDVAA